MFSDKDIDDIICSNDFKALNNPRSLPFTDLEFDEFIEKLIVFFNNPSKDTLDFTILNVLKFYDYLPNEQKERMDSNLSTRVGKEQKEKVVEIMKNLTLRTSAMLNKSLKTN